MDELIKDDLESRAMERGASMVIAYITLASADKKHYMAYCSHCGKELEPPYILREQCRGCNSWFVWMRQEWYGLIASADDSGK